MPTLETLPQTQHENLGNMAWRDARESYPLAAEIARSRRVQAVGSLAVRASTERLPAVEASADSTLLQALKEARSGDAPARQTIETNVQTAAAEILYKAGHQSQVALDFDGRQLTQSGRSLADIQANTLRYSTLNRIMRERSENELENALLFEELLAEGVLDDHDAVVFSLAPQDTRTKRDFGFFEETDTCSIQLLRRTAGREVILETALVAGKVSKHAPRHDLSAVERLAREHGSDIALDDSEASLRHVLLIPKDDIPRGVSDVVKRYDEAAGGTFYGQASGDDAVDYEAYAQQCEDKNSSLSDTVAQVSQALLDESHTFDTPTAAIKRLHKLTEQALVRSAVADEGIDARVFGQTSAEYIASARALREAGDMGASIDMQNRAIVSAVSSSCPLFDKPSTETADTVENLFSLGEDKYGSLQFTCKRGHRNKRPRNQLIETCQLCGVSVRC